jgi:hypothetical protein
VGVVKPEPRRNDRIEVGLFKIRLVRNGPFVGAAIQHDPACGWYALIDGVRQGEPNAEARLAPEVERIWLFGRPIELQEYRRITRAERNIAPRQPINLSKTGSIF